MTQRESYFPWISFLIVQNVHVLLVLLKLGKNEFRRSTNDEYLYSVAYDFITSLKVLTNLKNNLRMTFYKSKMCLMSASHDFSLCSSQCQKTQFKNHTKFEQFYGVKLLECIWQNH